MANSLFTRIFDKGGIDLNLGSTVSQVKVVYTNTEKNIESLSGNLYFPEVSVNLIESQQLYVLEEVTGPTSSFRLRKITGSVSVTSGSDYVLGTDTDFTSLTGGVDIKIGDYNYTILSVIGATLMQLDSAASVSETTDDVYWYDYLSYSYPLGNIGVHKEFINVRFENENQESFFLYDVDYTENIPYIQKTLSSRVELPIGSSVDTFTGRQIVTEPVAEPLQLNIGFSSKDEDIFEEKLIIDIERQYIGVLSDSPIIDSEGIVVFISGTDSIQNIVSNSTFYFQGVTGATSYAFYEKELSPLAVGITGSDTFIVFEYDDIPNVPVSSLSSYRILWKNIDNFATLTLYGETESEDERFRLVLENFGRKIDHDKEYIFRDSDINEGLPDYKLLNKKRKELLLEGDNIYPFIGSYKSLINIINYFGYYDLDIKEYFLNVDESSPNYDKFMQILIPKNDEQRRITRGVWEIVPSKMWKKTSYFGLYYDINRTTDEVDDYGIPIVEDAFMFSPEEVLIKLFGLKELLKEYFLPLNARIIDITGEGIYFERIRVDSWADNLNNLTINIGDLPEFTILPEVSYISDIRRIDQFYVNKFIEQGLTGFLGKDSDNPLLSASGASGFTVLSSIYPYSIVSYSSFLESPYDINGNLVSPVDNTWDYMPPGISNIDFNNIARRLHPLPDDEGIIAGAPVLLEAKFDITWEEGSFNWEQMSILGPTGSPRNINIWTWESIGRGQNIDCRWTIEKTGLHPFRYDSGRRPISDYNVETRGATLFTIPAKMIVTSVTGPSGGPYQIENVQITNPGFGYSTLPTVSVPGTTGTQASIEITLENGYIIDGTVASGGSDYYLTFDEFGATVYPSIFVDAPATSYETTTKTLHAVSLPYEGEYQIGLYLYDITNSFTVQFNKHQVNSRKPDFVSVHRKETTERTWEDFETPMSENVPDYLSFGEIPSSGARLVEWDEVTGPWYYPIHVFSSWDDAKISWESLNYSQFKDQTLHYENLDTSIVEINRDMEYVVLAGDQSNIVDIGDSLFFTRIESDIIEKDLEILPGNIGVAIPGILSGSIGSTAIGTSLSLVGILSSGDNIFLDGVWYTVATVTSSNIYINESVVTSISGTGVYYSSNRQVPITGISSSSNYSRILITTNSDFSSIDPQVDFYCYVDSVNGNFITESDDNLKKIIEKNSSVPGAQNQSVYLTWGLFSNTYSIEVLSKSLLGNNTRFNLKDVNKELYYIDGNFSVTNADYDVDYAEYRIGSNSLTFESATETTWEDAKSLSWFGLEYHRGVHCGFTVPFVYPGGSIRIDEYPSFQLSGDSGLIMIGITGAKSSLQIASDELTASINEGIRKFDYSVLPEDEIYMKNLSGTPLYIVSSHSNWIELNDNPDPLQYKIPAKVNATLVSGGIVISIPSTHRGYGYTLPPIITIPPPDTLGIQAVATTTIINSQVYLSFSAPGSGYTYVPEITIEFPENYKNLDECIWTGSEWKKVSYYDYLWKKLWFESSASYPISTNEPILLPYEYHKQLIDSTVLQQFYFFIHAKAINPSSEMLSYVSMEDGVEAEWLTHPNRTYSYPLRNSILYGAMKGSDYLYEKWEYEGSDYPPLSIPPEYSSNIQSLQSRVSFSQTLQSVYSFNDTVISNNQQTVPTFTPVVFNYDCCKIPGKNNPTWTIYNENTGKIEAISKTKNFMWNFTRDGNYSIKLEIEDSNGNKSQLKKTSFIVIGKKEKIYEPLSRTLLMPVS